MEVHWSQRRRSCEVCKKSKTRCQRLQPDDPQCVRCTILDVFCDPGQPKKVGRPKRNVSALPSDAESSSVKRRRPRSTFEITKSDAIERSINRRRTVLSGSSISSGTFELPLGKDDGLDNWVNAASLTIPAPGADFDVPGWPTIMTDHWYHRVHPVPSIMPSRIVSDSESDTSRGSNVTTLNLSPLGVVVQQAAYKQPCFRSNDALRRNPILLSFGIGRQSTITSTRTAFHQIQEA